MFGRRGLSGAGVWGRCAAQASSRWRAKAGNLQECVAKKMGEVRDSVGTDEESSASDCWAVQLWVRAGQLWGLIPSLYADKCSCGFCGHGARTVLLLLTPFSLPCPHGCLLRGALCRVPAAQQRDVPHDGARAICLPACCERWACPPSVGVALRRTCYAGKDLHASLLAPRARTRLVVASMRVRVCL